MLTIILIAVLAFAVAAAVGPILIPLLVKMKFGQSIREIGPSWHQKKSGTPTIGGLIFIAAIAVALLVFCTRLDQRVLAVALCALGFGVIGFIDDFIKVVLKRNLGLRAWQKLALQILVAAVFIYFTMQSGIINTVMQIPFTSFSVDLGWLYILLAFAALVAGDNSVNLTDGLDGLAASVTIVVMLFFTVVFGDTALGLFPAACVGGLLGFLLYNKYPARVFMGDTGSLFLGGAVYSLALVSGNPLIILLVGFVYLAEALSVIIQVTSFKLTGKRVFKMSPIHHHFEMCGWSEKKIVAVFSAVTAVLCVVSYFGI